MKFLRNLSLIAAAMSFLFVVGCGSQGSSSSEEAATEEAPAMEEAAVEEAPKMEEDAMEADSTMMEEADSVAAEN